MQGTQTWFVLDSLIPGFASSKTLLLKTIMSGSPQPASSKFGALVPPQLVQ